MWYTQKNYIKSIMINKLSHIKFGCTDSNAVNIRRLFFFEQLGQVVRSLHSPIQRIVMFSNFLKLVSEEVI
jgi:hypothetical protein